MSRTHKKNDVNGNSKNYRKNVTFQVIHRKEPSKIQKIKTSLAGYHTIHSYMAEMRLCGFIWIKPC